MMNAVNQQIKLAARPVGEVTRDDFELAEGPVPEAGEGQAVVEAQYISLDPAMRGWMNDAPSYVPPVGIGEVMRAIGVGRVVESRSPDVAEGDHVTGLIGVQRYAVLDAGALTKVDPELVPLPVYLSALGMPGMTAYFGLLEVGEAKQGDTVVVSAAAGAVGSVAGQIARIKGCRVVGIAGGEEKCAYIVDELGFDAAIDYKNDDVGKALSRHCPDGIDVYFDNVGGEILDAALARLAHGARIVICGAISQYNEDEMRGPRNYMMLLVRRARMQGFLVFDYASRYREAAREMGGWIAAGELKTREDVVPGLETFPETLLKLFRGENDGKLMLEVTPQS
jgi:NADPH-dependent curcumin reductase CurA